jgi:hypothetical protein
MSEKLEFHDNIIDQLQVTDKLYHTRLYRVHLATGWDQPYNLRSDRHEMEKKLTYCGNIL